MIGIALVLIGIGVVLLFIVPWVGIAAGAVGLLLVLLYFLGFGKPLSRVGPNPGFV